MADLFKNQDFPKESHVGPLEKVINLSDNAIDNLKSLIKLYDIKNVPGEYIKKKVADKFVYALYY